MSYQGRIPVPGVVTSVRSNKRDRRLQLETLHKKRQTDLEQQEKQRRQAEEVAQILATKWASEDRKKRSSDGVDDHRGGRLPGGDSPERARSRHHGIRARDSRPGLGDEYDGYGVETRESRGLRRYTDGETVHAVKRGAQWETHASTDIQSGGHRDDSGGSLEAEGGSRRDNVARTPRSESLRGQGESAGADEDQQVSSWHSVEHGLRREKGISGEGSAGSSELAVRAGTGSSQKAKEPPPKTKLKGVFGISDSDDDRETARSEMELVAQKKRARLSQQLTEPPRGNVGEKTSASGSTGGGGAAGGPPPSVAAVQMKVVQWKYGLKGRAAEMPEELRREVAAAMGVSYGRVPT